MSKSYPERVAEAEVRERGEGGRREADLPGVPAAVAAAQRRRRRRRVQVRRVRLPSVLGGVRGRPQGGGNSLGVFDLKNGHKTDLKSHLKIE